MMTQRPHSSHPGLSVQPDRAVTVHRTLPEEVAVAMVFDGSSAAVMMATPADVQDLAVGFALSEGIVTAPDQLDGFELAEHPDGLEARFWLRNDRAEALAARRGLQTVDAAQATPYWPGHETAARELPAVSRGPRFARAEVARATDMLRGQQPLHDQTHATHAAGFLVPEQGITLVREDVGRHNALDKLIGAMARQGIDPATGAVVMTSRLSVELVQKCAVAGVTTLIAVSAPTAHALRLADGVGMTLAAFARGGGFDIYSHPHRIVDEVSDVA